MKIEIKLANNTNGFIIKNMYPLYLHDICGIHKILPNKYGIFEDDNTVKTLMDEYDMQQIWFEHPNELFPYIIFVNDNAAGFCLIGSGKYVPKDVDFYVYETFLLSPYRGKNISHKAILEILSRHHGKWMLYTHSTDNNKRAQAFWHKTVGKFTNNNYTTKKEIIDNIPKLVFRFEN
ncbi:MAG: GNAT family N-acetyltransferase [Clostridiaceae bacterium]|nr:GNAT family N-acetyltransferase [Clostridiaceae bacterium]